MFTRYKRARRIGRMRQRSIAYNRLDFSWRGGKQNPFFEKESKMPIRKKILLFACGIAALGSLGVLLLHPFFSIQGPQIKVEGLDRIDEKELKETVIGIMS